MFCSHKIIDHFNFNWQQTQHPDLLQLMATNGLMIYPIRWSMKLWMYLNKVDDSKVVNADQSWLLVLPKTWVSIVGTKVQKVRRPSLKITTASIVFTNTMTTKVQEVYLPRLLQKSLKHLAPSIQLAGIWWTTPKVQLHQLTFSLTKISRHRRYVSKLSTCFLHSRPLFALGREPLFFF